MQKTEVTLICDLTGEPADETVRFGVDGASYEIDVTAVKAKELREALAPYIAAGRRVSNGTVRAARSSTSTTGSRAEAKRARAWAQAQGLPVGDRGRIPAEIVARYRAEVGV